MEKSEGKIEDALEGLNTELASQLSALRGLISHSPSHSQDAPTPELSVYLRATKSGADPKFAAALLTNTLQGLKREGKQTQNLDEPRLLSLFKANCEGAFTRAAAADILRRMCDDREITPEAAAEQLELQRISGKSLSNLIEKEHLDLKALMAKYRLRVDAQQAQEILGKKKAD